MLIKKNGKWYCETHQVELEIASKKGSNKIFLVCPCSPECGTIDEGNFNPIDYECYNPKLKAAVLDEFRRQIEDNEIDYPDMSKFHDLF